MTYTEVWLQGYLKRQGLLKVPDADASLEPPVTSLILPFPPSLWTLYASVDKQYVHKSGKVHTAKGLILTKTGKAYKTHAVGAARQQYKQQAPMTGPLHLSLELHPPDKRQRDLDNYLKILQDTLTEAQVWTDDSQIAELHCRWATPNEPGYVAVLIERV